MFCSVSVFGFKFFYGLMLMFMANITTKSHDYYSKIKSNSLQSGVRERFNIPQKLIYKGVADHKSVAMFLTTQAEEVSDRIFLKFYYNTIYLNRLKNDKFSDTEEKCRVFIGNQIF